MKKLFAWLLSVTLMAAIAGVCVIPAAAAAPEITAEAAYMMDADTGEVIYAKNETAQLYPASTTKLMTALLVLEHLESDAELDKEIACPSAAVSHENLSGDGSSAGLRPGEILTVRELLSFLLIPSANDAANVLAQYTAGSVEDFVVMMNRRAAELGMTGTHYANPHGETDPDHYTCAKDLSLVMKELVRQKTYTEIATTLQIKKDPTNKYKQTRTFNNTNKLIYKDSTVYCPYVICGKTGFTTPAGYCLASYGEYNGMRVVCITLKSAKAQTGGGYHFSDQRKLYQWVFESLYEEKELLKDGAPVFQAGVRLSEQTDSVAVIAEGGVTAMLNKETFDEKKIRLVPVDGAEKAVLTAPVEAGAKVGSLQVFYGDRLVDTVGLKTIAGASRSEWLYFTDRVRNFFSLGVVRLAIVLAVVALVSFAVYREVQVRKKERENRLRKYR